MVAHTPRGAGRVYELDNVGGQLEQAELLQLVGDGKGHAAVVLLRGHVLRGVRVWCVVCVVYMCDVCVYW